MHQHRLVLNGPPAAVALLADDLSAAGAVAVPGSTSGPPRMVWATAGPATLEGLCARHHDVAVGAERFELLGDELQRLVVQGSDATVLERRSLADLAELAERDPCLEEEGAPLDPEALRRAARHVMVAPPGRWPGPTCSALDDAMELGVAVGRMCSAVGSEGPCLAGLHTVAALGATALSIGAPPADGDCTAEREFERSWRLTQATARAGREELWARPGEANWPEWLMELLTGVARVTECCAAALHQPPGTLVSLHTEHFGTEEEQLEQTVGWLVATVLQTLVLFRGERRP
jgi:hypothetical protein